MISKNAVVPLRKRLMYVSGSKYFFMEISPEPTCMTQQAEIFFIAPFDDGYICSCGKRKTLQFCYHFFGYSISSDHID
jgi:hypothetical protein